jgi:hypothetical protein
LLVSRSAARARGRAVARRGPPRVSASEGRSREAHGSAGTGGWTQNGRKGRGVSDPYGRRDETRPVSTGEGTRRVRLVPGRRLDLELLPPQLPRRVELHSALALRPARPAPVTSAPAPGALAATRGGAALAPPPLPRTNRTRRVPHPVLIGHAASLTPYESDTPRPSPRTNRTRRSRSLRSALEIRYARCGEGGRVPTAGIQATAPMTGQRSGGAARPAQSPSSPSPPPVLTGRVSSLLPY